MTIKAIIFDVGFTLITQDNFTVENYLETLSKGLENLISYLKTKKILSDSNIFREKFKKLQFKWIEKSLSDLKEYPTDYIIEKIFKEMNIKENKKDIKKYARVYHLSSEGGDWKPFPDAAETLKILKNHYNFKLGVISNTPWHEGVELALKSFKLRKYFDFVITSAKFGIKKPDPKIFKEALDHFGISPEEAVYIGDDLINDIYGAKSLGLRAIQMEKGFEFPTQSNVTIEPDAKVKKISEIIPVIEDWIN